MDTDTTSPLARPKGPSVRRKIARGMKSFQIRRRVALALLDLIEQKQVVTRDDLVRLRDEAMQ